MENKKDIFSSVFLFYFFELFFVNCFHWANAFASATIYAEDANILNYEVLDSNGNLRSTYDILLDISKVYKEIQEEDKKYGTNRASALVETLAGEFLPEIYGNVYLRTYLIALIA